MTLSLPPTEPLSQATIERPSSCGNNLIVWVDIDSPTLGPPPKAHGQIFKSTQTPSTSLPVTVVNNQIYLWDQYKNSCVNIHFKLRGAPNNWTFQYDNDPIHTADASGNFSSHGDPSFVDVSADSSGARRDSFHVVHDLTLAKWRDHTYKLFPVDDASKKRLEIDPKVHDGGVRPSINIVDILELIGLAVVGVLSLVGLDALMRRWKASRIRDTSP